MKTIYACIYALCVFFVCVHKLRCTVISISVSQCVSICINVFVCVHTCIYAIGEDKCVYCVFYSKHLCVYINKFRVFLIAFVCIYKNLLHTCTCVTVFNNYATTYLYALLIQITSR